MAIDVERRTVSSAFRISLPRWNLGSGTASALSPDGKTIAIADNETVATVDLTTRKISARDPATALALGYSPDGATLWKLS